VVPISDPSDKVGYALNPFAVINGSSWSIHHVSLDCLNALDISKPKLISSWLDPLLTMQLSDSERTYLGLSGSAASVGRGTLTGVKETINTLFAEFSGMRGGARAPIVALVEPQALSAYMFIFIHQIRVDSASFSVVLDAAILPLEPETEKAVEQDLARLSRGGIPKIKTPPSEALTWRRMLPALVERCRTWDHGPNCEYDTNSRIPLSNELVATAICSCGRGRNLPSGLHNQRNLKNILPYATRVAISPLFAVPYVEQVIGGMANTASSSRGDAPGDRNTCQGCGGPGKPNLLSCSRCKRVRYCSAECQRRDWKAGHKQRCEST
jgi:hypothetical protein